MPDKFLTLKNDNCRDATNITDAVKLELLIIGKFAKPQFSKE